MIRIVIDRNRDIKICSCRKRYRTLIVRICYCNLPMIVNGNRKRLDTGKAIRNACFRQCICSYMEILPYISRIVLFTESISSGKFELCISGMRSRIGSISIVVFFRYS